jgi:hypothetical protein
MIIQCNTTGVITAVERLCRQSNVEAMGAGFDVACKPTRPLLIQIAEHPAVSGGAQLWYSVGFDEGGHIVHSGWICDVQIDGAPLYVDTDDLLSEEDQRFFEEDERTAAEDAALPEGWGNQPPVVG